MTEPTPLLDSKCEHPDCGAEDNHPKFHLLAPTADGLGWKTYHHDCAAVLGHVKASLVVEHTNGAKGDELRALLNNPDHALHAAILEHTEREASEIHARNKAILNSNTEES